jgi:ribosomal RNA-processing protein 17
MPPPFKRRRVTPLLKSKGPQPEEITFNLDARQDYLTGFHKRKVQRTKAAQEAAERRAKDEKRQHRQKLREERKRELEERVRIVDAYIKPSVKDVSVVGSDESEDDSGVEADVVVPEPVLEKIDHEAEYVDEDKYTSVVVEEVDVDRDGFVHEEGSESDGEAQAEASVEQPELKKTNGDVKTNSRRRWTVEKPKDAAAKAKKKRKKFRYESKAERKIERGKQRAKNSKQAKARREK